MIAARQAIDLRPKLERLDALLLRSTGLAPAALSFEFRPLWQMDAAASATIALQKAQATQIYAGLNLWPAGDRRLPCQSVSIDRALKPPPAGDIPAGDRAVFTPNSEASRSRESFQPPRIAGLYLEHIMTTVPGNLYGDILFHDIPSTTIPTGAMTLQTAGFKIAGLGAASYNRVPAGPASNARAQSADGAWWDLAETHVDPTMVGALANGYTFSDLQFQKSSDLTLATFVSGLYSFTTDNIGAPIRFWNPASSSMFSTTISQINVSANTVQLAAAPPTSPPLNTNLQGELGTDDAVAINFAMSLCGWPDAYGGQNARYTPTAYPGGGTGWWNQGTRTLVFRSAGRFISRYCVSSPVRLLSGASVEWEDGAWLVALPNFGAVSSTANQAVMHQTVDGNGAAVDIVGCKLTNVQINAGGFADKCLWIEQGSENTIDRGAKLYGGVNRGLKLGPNAGSSARLVTTVVNGLVRAEWGVGTSTTPFFPNSPTSIGVEFGPGNTTDNYIDDIFSVGYRTGFADTGANNRVKDLHVWAGLSSMTTGALLGGYASKFGRIYIDTLYAPSGTAGTTTSVGLDISQASLEIDSVASTVNVAYGTQDNTMTLILPRQTTTKEVHIGSVFCSSGSPSCKWLQVVDPTAAGYPYLKIDDLTTDGNVYTIGYETPSQLNADVSTTSARAVAAFRSRIEALENAISTAPWNPIKIAPAVQLWLDASSPDTILFDGGLGVKSWASRIGSTAAVQTSPALRPTFNPTGWDGTLPSIDFDGLNDVLSLPQFFTNNLTDFRVFLVWRRNTQSAQNVNHYIMYVSNQGDIAHGMVLQCRVLSTTADPGQTVVQYGQSGAGTNQFSVGAATKALTSFSADAATTSTSAANPVTVKARLNGATSTASVSSGNTGVVASNTNSYLGGGSVGTNAAMSLCEIVVLTGGLTTNDAEDRKIEGYLAWKWGINGLLPSGHPYSSSAPLYNS